MSDSVQLPGSLQPDSTTAAGSLHELSDSDSSSIEPIASTSAVRLDATSELADADTSSGLRERVRSPYSATLPPRREAISKDTSDAISASASGNSKGKQRAVDEPSDVKPTNSNGDEEVSPFSCHICLETPSSDNCVVTKCGHLFCWSDLSAWLDSNPPTSSSCPVCKSVIKDIQEEVIPIYSGSTSSSKQVDPRTRPRPKPKVNPAAVPAQRSGLFGGGMQGISPFWDFGGGAGSGWTVQAGVFPFPGMSFGWSSGTRPMAMGNAAQAQTQEEAQEQARTQQRNALITFVVMIVLFALMSTLAEMDIQ